MDEGNKIDPKFSLPEIIFVGLFLLVIDVLDVVGLIFALPVSDVTELAEFPATGIYFKLKGVNQTYMLISNAIGFIPWVGDLPLRIITFGWMAYTDRHPKAGGAFAGTLQKATAATSVAKGKAGAGGKGGVAGAGGKAAPTVGSVGTEKKGPAGSRPSQKQKPETKEPQPSAAKGRSPKEAAEGEQAEQGNGSGTQGKKDAKTDEALGEQPTPFEKLESLTQKTPQTGNVRDADAEDEDEEEPREAA